MRKALVLLALWFLGGCAVPVGNLAALQGEGLQLGTRLTLAGPYPSTPEVDPAVPAAGTVFAAYVKPWWYAKGEVGLFPVVGLGTGGSLAAGAHWKDRVALGGHLVVNDGAGYGLDVAVRPLPRQPWIAGFSWTPEQTYPQDSTWAELPRPRIELHREMEWSLGWSPAPEANADGALSIEGTLRHGGNGWVAGLRLTAATRLFVPEGR